MEKEIYNSPEEYLKRKDEESDDYADAITRGIKRANDERDAERKAKKEKIESAE